MVLLREFNGLEKRGQVMSLLDAKARLLMSTPAVGPIISLTYASAIDDPPVLPHQSERDRCSG
jgi:hypothetical protein